MQQEGGKSRAAKGRSPAVFSFPSCKGEAVALPQALRSSGRWSEAKEQDKDGRTLLAWSGRRVGSHRRRSAWQESASQRSSRHAMLEMERPHRLLHRPMLCVVCARGMCGGGRKGELPPLPPTLLLAIAPPRAVGAQARHGLPSVGSAPGPTGADARGLGSASSARPPPPPSSRTASHRCHASRPLSCADPGRQDLRDAVELLCIVPCAAPWGSSVMVAAYLPRWCGLTSSSHGGAPSSSCVETVGGGAAREGQGGGPGEARRWFAE
jgi:hypothetical protein